MRKHTIDYIREEFFKYNYILLSDTYINVHNPLNFICPNGHTHKISFCAWKKGQRCKKCVDDFRRYSIELVRYYFYKEGYELLSDKYINNRQKLEVICPSGHITDCTFDNFRSGFRCKHCAKNVKHNIEFIREQFEKEGYELITKHYVNSKQKLKYMCTLGHIHEITWTDWYNGGYRCPTCWAISICGSGNNQWKGGKSFEEYCPVWRDKDYKESIRYRDGNKCINCYCYSKRPNDLTVHHIDYNKKNCHHNNLITLCRVCNILANKDREWHKAWYQAIMYRRYNYNY
jgi:hypothetical protein